MRKLQINGRGAHSEKEAATQAGVRENRPERDRQSGGTKWKGIMEKSFSGDRIGKRTK